MRRGVRWAAGLAVLVLLTGVSIIADQMFDLFGGRARDCERILTETVTRVPSVLSAEVNCNLQFGGGWQRQTVRLSADTEEEAYPIVEQILRAVARVGEIDSSWSTPEVYELTSGATLASLEPIGFNGPPSVGSVRSRYGIQPVR